MPYYIDYSNKSEGLLSIILDTKNDHLNSNSVVLSELYCSVLCTTVVPSHMHTHMSSSYRQIRSTFILWVCFCVCFLNYVSLFVIGLDFLCIFLVVSTSAINFQERLVSEMTNCLPSGI